MKDKCEVCGRQVTDDSGICDECLKKEKAMAEYMAETPFGHQLEEGSDFGD